MLVNKLIPACLSLLLIATAPLWAQTDSSATQSGEGAQESMVTPTPVSGAGLPLTFSMETPRTNYLRGGLRIQSAYENNVIPSAVSPASDIDYLLSPMIMLTVTGARTKWDLSYMPTFTMYQHNSVLNHIDHELQFGFEYRFSPHVKLSLENVFSKSPNILSLTDQNATESRVGVIEKPNYSILAPVPERISDFGNATITYQFGPNSMIGVKGTLSELWYPNKVNAGMYLFDSTAQAVEGFYSRRFSRNLYAGASYDFQKLLAHPSVAQTKTQSIVLFTTLYLGHTQRFSLSMFAGPQQSDTRGGPEPSLRMWSPEIGAGFGWQGAHTSFLAGYEQRVTEGGGLSNAVRTNSSGVVVRRQLLKTLTADLGGSYATNSILNSLPAGSGTRVLSGGITLQHPLGEHLRLEVGYARLHQTFNSIPTTSKWTPNADRAWASISYEFERALGR